ncbi:hypothetical protein [Flammeovirga sp. SJP92]|uniref:hypothetical protein n=1 Tax=Flammeovirga sp. SJP92 TaxID=1775430 RepID=UPI00078708EC|nr:hypothetical protein [Flammeovirga sp. SJP92]KXX72749.1 hypothetical protein AVL50_32125 [Flammeovirga sp. SJP92]
MEIITRISLIGVKGIGELSLTGETGKHYFDTVLISTDKNEEHTIFHFQDHSNTHKYKAELKFDNSSFRWMIESVNEGDKLNTIEEPLIRMRYTINKGSRAIAYNEETRFNWFNNDLFHVQCDQNSINFKKRLFQILIDHLNNLDLLQYGEKLDLEENPPIPNLK